MGPRRGRLHSIVGPLSRRSGTQASCVYQLLKEAIALGTALALLGTSMSEARRGLMIPQLGTIPAGRGGVIAKQGY